MAVYEAVQKRKPLVERIVTVTGKGMKTPSNYLVRMGTPIASLVEAAGGLPEGDVKVLNGGPMMGRAMVDLSSPVTKGCSGITVLGGAEAQRGAESACIKCAKCVQACPMGLEPYLLSKLSRKQLWERLEGEEVTSCIECGCCQFTCPADLPLLDYIRLGKQRVMGLIRAVRRPTLRKNRTKKTKTDNLWQINFLSRRRRMSTVRSPRRRSCATW